MSSMDTVHVLGMPERGSRRLTVDRFYNEDKGEMVSIHPPLNIILEGVQKECVAVAQNGLAARYSNQELEQIGEGNMMLGLDRVIGEVAAKGHLELDSIRPLHSACVES